MKDEEIFKEIKRRMIEEARLFENYVEYYNKRDFVKASEFLWGSISNLVYALGLLYGKQLTKHRESIQFLRELVSVNGEEKFKGYIKSAEALHSNFYHGWISEDTFEEYARDVEELRKWLKEFLEIELTKLRNKTSI